jgi:hypothetical protein
MDNQVVFASGEQIADVAELADAQASGACGLNARVGSIPIIRIKPATNFQTLFSLSVHKLIHGTVLLFIVVSKTTQYHQQKLNLNRRAADFLCCQNQYQMKRHW